MESGSVRFVFRHFFSGGLLSVRAAQASDCAAEQDRFWEYHDALFESWAGEQQPAFDDANLISLAGGVGLDTTQFGSCLSSGSDAEELQIDIRDAGILGVRAVPTLIINGRRVEGLQSYDFYRSVIEEELTQAR